MATVVKCPTCGATGRVVGGFAVPAVLQRSLPAHRSWVPGSTEQHRIPGRAGLRGRRRPRLIGRTARGLLIQCGLSSGTSAGAAARSDFTSHRLIRSLMRHWPALRLAGGQPASSCRCAARASICSGCASRDMRGRRGDLRHRARGVLHGKWHCRPGADRAMASTSTRPPASNCIAGISSRSRRECSADVAAVYDRAALISWSDELRESYVRHLLALLKPGTQMLLHRTGIPPGANGGPAVLVEARRNRAPVHARLQHPRDSTGGTFWRREPRMRAREVAIARN